MKYAMQECSCVTDHVGHLLVKDRNWKEHIPFDSAKMYHRITFYLKHRRHFQCHLSDHFNNLLGVILSIIHMKHLRPNICCTRAKGLGTIYITTPSSIASTVVRNNTIGWQLVTKTTDFLHGFFWVKLSLWSSLSVSLLPGFWMFLIRFTSIGRRCTYGTIIDIST